MAEPVLYPPYQVEFVRGATSVVASSPELPPAGVSVLGPHTFVFTLTPTGPRVQVTLDRNGIASNGGPHLVVTFSEIK